MSQSVSVVIPAYNTERFIQDALESVLQQTVTPGEVIVVNDGSSDRTADLVAAYNGRVRCVRQENLGTASARNTGVRLAQGEFLAFLDADDYWAKDKLEQQLAVLYSHKVDMVLGHAQVFVDKAMRDAPPPDENSVQPGILAGALLIGRESFLRVGFFDEELRLGEFLDWYNRACLMGLTQVMLPNIVLHRRIHDANTTRRLRQGRRGDYLKMLKAKLDAAGQSGQTSENS
jgi:glycosyltransferase involved in cell wall biosynthesis